MREIENYCVECPQGCIHCGRDEDVEEVFCDICGSAEDTMYEWYGTDYCEADLFVEWADENIKYDSFNYGDPRLPKECVDEYISELMDSPRDYFYDILQFMTNEAYEDWYEFKKECEIGGN